MIIETAIYQSLIRLSDVCFNIVCILNKNQTDTYTFIYVNESSLCIKVLKFCCNSNLFWKRTIIKLQRATCSCIYIYKYLLIIQ